MIIIFVFTRCPILVLVEKLVREREKNRGEKKEKI